MPESSSEESEMKSAELLKTPEKDDCEQLKYTETPVSSETRSRSLVAVIENKQKSPASESDRSGDSAESRYKIYYQRDDSALNKVRVSLFHKVNKKVIVKGKGFSMDATSFYGPPTKERVLPLAPDVLGPTNKKLEKNKPSPSTYDIPNPKKVARKRKSGEVNSGVGHGIKKLKGKVGSTKNVLSEADEHIVMEKKRRSSQKENAGEVANSQDNIEYYNPKKKFFKYKRPEKCEISVGAKPRQKKDTTPKESVVSYSNIFGSSNSKKQFCKQLTSKPTTRSNSKVKSSFEHSPDVFKTGGFDQYYQHRQDAQESVSKVRDSKGLNHSKECSNLEAEAVNKVNECTDGELPHQNLAMDIENNNFSNNEMITDLTNHDTEELKNQMTGGNNSFLVGSLASNSFEQNHSDGNSSDNRPLECSSNSEQYQMNVDQSDISNIQCQECNFVYEVGNKIEELAHSDHHRDYCALQFQGWKVNYGRAIGCNIGNKIVMIKPHDPSCIKRKAFEVLQVANRELGLYENQLNDMREQYFFLFVTGKFALGVLVAEYLEYAFKLESNSSAPSRIFSETTPVKCGIKAIWVSKNYRRQGIAAAMIDSLRENFVDNYQMALEDIAIAIPTPSGRLFAEKYFGTSDLKVF